MKTVDLLGCSRVKPVSNLTWTEWNPVFSRKLVKVLRILSSKCYKTTINDQTAKCGKGKQG
jgi:hypothetical protein